MTDSNDSAPPKLSPAERKVLTRLMRGQSLKMIAAEMKISAKTVSTYKSRIMAKLDVHSNAELVVHAMLHYGMGGIYFNFDE